MILNMAYAMPRRQSSQIQWIICHSVSTMGSLQSIQDSIP